jgi:hypothetical protein
MFLNETSVGFLASMLHESVKGSLDWFGEQAELCAHRHFLI